jgi:hypothetical protein
MYEIDLQNLLIQKTEEILQTNLQEFQKVNSFVKSYFDLFDYLDFNNIKF